MSSDETQFRDVHGYLIRDLKTICAYEHDDLDDLKRVCLACQTQLQTDGDSITVGQIEKLYNDLANAKTQWTEKVGRPKMKYYSNGGHYTYGSYGYRPEEGVRNNEIYNVKTELDGCLEKLLNMKKILSRILETRPPSFIPTPASPGQETVYLRNSHLHPSQTQAETEIFVRAFIEPIDALNTWMDQSTYPPMGFKGTGLWPYVDEVVKLLQPARSYLDGQRPRPTVDQVRAILMKLEAAADHAAGVRGVHDHWNWRVKVHACGPPLKAYIDYIDPEQSESLPWRDGWKTTLGSKMHTADVQTLLHRMKKIYI